jgi:hypothetical protein
MWHALNLAGHLTSLSGPARAWNPFLPVGVMSLARNHRGGLGVLSRIPITVIFPRIRVLCDALMHIILS